MTATQTTTDTAVRVVLIGRDGDRVRVLTFQRRGGPYRGCWALPGGMVDTTEQTLLQAAVRELAEAGIHLEACELAEVDSARTLGGAPVSVAFAALLPDCPASTAPSGGRARWTLLEVAVDTPGMLVPGHHLAITDAIRMLDGQAVRR
ncbi:hypothetical protein CFN78_28130 [Amycolatopsis antarctica]|uniref:Nudix hydrolase domain-containing protein n=1 Tax=Amycolatopsis antarctica TaxID=1854586 RepID=A0A263CXS6_9PSEU|nr:NUDIX domain-containing protein [Amycolatopsis antarctica]OZM69895.1 hypothetical protein CFN78_28130 [Amycolatopsis antarctica]